MPAFLDSLTSVTAPAGKTSPKSAPKPATWAYAEDFRPETEIATEARARGVELDARPLGRGTASLLTLMARAIGARAVVEIGTGAGASSLALFAGMQPDGILTSVDIEPEHQHAARRALLATGIKPQRFRLIAGAALHVLPRLRDGAYDLVYIDADKLEYPDYVVQALRLLRHGGLLILDNALWHDAVADPAQTDDQTEAIRAALTLVADDDDLVSALLPVGDGLLAAVKG